MLLFFFWPQNETSRVFLTVGLAIPRGDDETGDRVYTNVDDRNLSNGCYDTTVAPCARARACVCVPMCGHANAPLGAPVRMRVPRAERAVTRRRGCHTHGQAGEGP